MIDNNPNQSEKSRDVMLSGSAWMTAGSILSRFLGAVYIIPGDLVWQLFFPGKRPLWTGL